ncbi:MAG: Outer membrane protein assembly factor BamD [Verrucomicrobia subdivision 3 bacterium]|nr:Outer membrane protein assembly factor BamD [Limisphaerales bacterium]MCS1413565.1 Outer membrane protein assembly factor BamD [Limisphaerales bacterium]
MSKESAGSLSLIEFLTWLETHMQKLILGGVAAVVFGGVVYVSNWKADQAEQAAGTALYELQAREGQGGDVAEPTAEEYLSVLEAHPNTTAGERALLLAAQAHFVAGRFNQAREQFERFGTLYGDSEFIATALYGVAASYDAAANYSEAKVAYQAILNRFPNTSTAAQAKLATAGIHEAQDEPREAVALYDELNRPGIPSTYSTRALLRREKIFKEHPELRPKPEPEPVRPTDDDGIRAVETTGSDEFEPAPSEGVSTETTVLPDESAAEDATAGEVPAVESTTEPEPEG